MNRKKRKATEEGLNNFALKREQIEERKLQKEIAKEMERLLRRGCKR